MVSSSVKHISECFVKPKEQLEEQKKPIHLSPWDLAMFSANYIQKGLLYSRKNSSIERQTLLNQLKEALSVTLVHFHLLAGRFETQLSEEDDGSSSSRLVFIDPTKGPGAGLIHASADHLSISDILSPTDDDVPRVVQSFFDHDRAVNHDGHDRPLLTIQVTELLDGIFIGCSLNHACGDGTSYWHFFNSFSEIFMKKLNGNIEDTEISREPIHTRLFLDGTGPVVKLPFAHTEEFITRFEPPLLRERIFHFSSEAIRGLRSRANSETDDNNKISSFQALSALMWRCITRARKLPADEEVNCKLAINNRIRLDPPVSANYFGNCIQLVQSSTKAGELLEHSLGWAALRLNQAVNAHRDKQVRDSYAGWMKTPMVYQMGSYFTGNLVTMGSSPRFNMYGNEFGMGKPVAVLSGYANKFDGKVTSYPGKEGNDSVDLETCLLPEYMSALETDEEFMSVVS